MHKINQIEGFEPWDASDEKERANIPEVEIESFCDRLGVELWPNYCFETQNLDFCQGAPGLNYDRSIDRAMKTFVSSVVDIDWLKSAKSRLRYFGHWLQSAKSRLG